jgi:hypothetical protein
LESTIADDIWSKFLVFDGSLIQFGIYLLDVAQNFGCNIFFPVRGQMNCRLRASELFTDRVNVPIFELKMLELRAILDCKYIQFVKVKLTACSSNSKRVKLVVVSGGTVKVTGNGLCSSFILIRLYLRFRFLTIVSGLMLGRLSSPLRVFLSRSL